MTDAELDEAILATLRTASQALSEGQSSQGTRTSQGLADATGELLGRVEKRVKALETSGHIRESQAAPSRWMLAQSTP